MPEEIASFEINGVEEVIARMQAYKPAAFRGAVRAMGLIELDEVGEARKIVPKLSGFLESQIINLPVAVKAINGRDMIEGVVVARTPYAHYQHENVLDHSNSRRPDAQDHYLTKPAKARAPQHAALFARVQMEELKAAGEA